MFGTGKSSIFVENVLSDNVKILAYIDNDKSKWGKTKNNILILSPDAIKKFDYDYIIIGSQFNDEIYDQLISRGILRTRIFQYYKFIDQVSNYYKYFMDIFKNSSIDIEVFLTGISYSYQGFREDICLKKAFKFAFGSQDIFYDYHTIKYLLENFPKKTSNVRYVIIGLCYYSFQYDMSLSSMKGKSVLYYEVIKEAHHFKDIEKVHDEYDINKRIADKIFRKNADGNYDFKWNITTLKDCEDIQNTGKKQAELDCNKNHQKTVKENTQIFKDYLQLLKQYNIKPIVAVYPATKYYTDYFSKKIEDEFHSIISEVKKEYDFQYIDYFRSDLFNNDDFQDVSHLNSQGAEKFTKILNEEIEW